MKKLLIFSILIFFTYLNIIAQTSIPSFNNPGPITICVNGSYYLNPSITDGTWASSNTSVAVVNASGYVTGLTLGTATITLTNNSGTASATVTVGNSASIAISDGSVQPNYRFDNSAHGPIDGTINYIGYNGFDFASQTPPINTGYYRASKQLNAEASCPYEYYIIKCDACGSYSVTQNGLVLNLDAGNTSSYNNVGTTWYDLNGTNNGSMTNVTFTTNPGYFNFNGSSSKISFSNGITSGDNLTYEAWVNPSSLGGFSVIANSNNWSNGYVHFQFHGTQPSFDLNGGGDQISSASFSVNTWYNLVAVYSRSNKTVSFYVNGVLIDTKIISGSPPPIANTPFTIGSWSNSRFFNGKIAIFRAYNVALDATQIQQNYNALKSRFGL